MTHTTVSVPTNGSQPPPLQIGMVLFPGFTLLDLAGPQGVLGLHGQTHLLWKTLGPVRSDTGIALQATTTFQDCPADLDILFVPGGLETFGAIEDAELLQFLRERAPRARYVTSVCSGALILGAAGLLHGYKSTTHWALHSYLAETGAEPVQARIVTDRNRVSGGGVTAGIDFGLSLLARLRGDDVAKATQLMLEYDPEPPFDSGSPRTAPPEILKQVQTVLEPLNQRTQRAIQQACSNAPRAVG